MNIKRMKIMGSDYLGLFGIVNDSLCFLPNNTAEKEIKEVEKTLDVKVVQTSIYESSLLSVFSKMNNKTIFLPSYILQKELETIEKEIKVKIIDTGSALGNLIELNDEKMILSKSITEVEKEQIKEEGLDILNMNLAKTNAIGSSILLTNNNFVINPNASEEEIKEVQEFLGMEGGSATANTGDAFIRNSVLANKKGFIVGERTTGHEINRIDEALEERK
jgi:translation initiation factor 6